MGEAMDKLCYGYLRVSGRGQVEGDGFPRQREAIKTFCEAQSVRVARYFQEEGVSGTKDLEDRPALSELLETIINSDVRTVMVEKLDRLARDLMVQETLISEFCKHGIELISVAEPDLCSDDPSRKLVRQMFGAIAEYEKSMIVLKLRGARQRVRAKTGRCEGAKPYGERDGEQAIVERVKQYAGLGMNYSQIAGQLNQDGVKTRIGGSWYPMGVSRLLSRVSA
jgi:DNA invertase Pin-like site-specific DNA recombinase